MSFLRNAPQVSAAFIMLSLSACGMQSQLSDMHDKTAQMNDTTTRLAAATDDMGKKTQILVDQTAQSNTTLQGVAKDSGVTTKTTQKLADTNQHMYIEMRQGGTVTSRKDALAAMKAETTIPAKVKQAVIYNEAFEFEFWKPESESAADLAKLKEDGAREFMAAVQEYTGDMSSTSPASRDPQMENLYAIAATLHYSNRVEYAAPGEQPVTILSMIEDALKSDEQIQEGKLTAESLPGYQTMILRQKPVAVYLLQVRQNFLSAFPLDKLANIEHRNILAKAYMSFLPWDARLPSMSIEEIQYQTYILKLARETREFLQDVSIDPKSNAEVLRLYQNMRMPSKTAFLSRGAEKDLPQSLTDLEQEVKQLVEQN